MLDSEVGMIKHGTYIRDPLTNPGFVPIRSEKRISGSGSWFYGFGESGYGSG